ncbi:cell cycle control [Fusarium heterosporum]|uniref:Cell cycle control n=1 Tax=Fusarium heterosporum TaxID=42747 RepID=A0A8H5TUH8_FUSHE|nr:cell cycle control [Fusarium heterosporum]
MADNSDDFLEMLDEDDLVELQANSARNQNNSGQLFLPNPSAPAAFPTHRRAQHVQRHSRRNRASLPPQQPQEPAPVIDLTEEPDSPVLLRAAPAPAAGPAVRNPRRTNSQRISPPQLSRTDGTFVGRTANVIDLTVDSPEEERPRNYSMRAARVIPFADELIELEIISQRPALGALPSFAALGPLRRLAGILGGASFTQPNLDISRNAFARQPSPKPAMELPPPAREGFSRNTCTDPEEPERVVICPACNEELAYDPTGTATASSVGSSKGKRKRAPGEHHFWAVKKCGHVYCADCYENRRPSKTNRDGAGFRGPNGQLPSGSTPDIRCVVEGCDSKVATKTEWVGIFL